MRASPAKTRQIIDDGDVLASWPVDLLQLGQAGQKRAEYGEGLVRRFALDFTEQFGRGFGFSQVKMMHQIYYT